MARRQPDTSQGGPRCLRHVSAYLLAKLESFFYTQTRVWITRLLVKPAHLNFFYVTEDGAPDPLNHQRLDTAAPQKLHFTVEPKTHLFVFPQLYKDVYISTQT